MQHHGVVLLDGGTGSELRRRGVMLDAVAWTGPAALTHFDTLTAIHADYIGAGADVITTNTFGTTRFVLDAAGFTDAFESVNRAAVEAAQRARELAGRHVRIAGSISCLPPGFDTSAYPSPRTELDSYRELANLLAESGVDLLVLEMMEDLEHARRACEAAREVGLPFWVGVSARLDADQRNVVAYDFPQTTLASVLDELLDYAPAAVNVMHTPIDALTPALAEVKARWRGVRGVYPELDEINGTDRSAHRNRPKAQTVPMKRAAAIGPARLGELALDWIADGARIVGGCCGTTPEHIRGIADAIGRSV